MCSFGTFLAQEQVHTTFLAKVDFLWGGDEIFKLKLHLT
jgi:hypothetical protein